MPTMNTRTHFLCIGPQCWGIATNVGAAVAAAKKNWPSYGQPGRFFSYDVWSVPASTYVDYLGMIRCDVGDPPPLKLREIRFSEAGQRAVRQVNMTSAEMAKALEPKEIH